MRVDLLKKFSILNSIREINYTILFDQASDYFFRNHLESLYAQHVREAIDKSDDLGDADKADLYTEICRTVDMRLSSKPTCKESTPVQAMVGVQPAKKPFQSNNSLD